MHLARRSTMLQMSNMIVVMQNITELSLNIVRLDAAGATGKSRLVCNVGSGIRCLSGCNLTNTANPD